MVLALVLSTQREDAQFINDVLRSWPVQVAVLLLFAAIAVLAFTRVARDFDDARGTRLLRAGVVALGVFLGLQVALGGDVLGVVVWPVWLQVVELLWLFALWLYYFARFMTRQRRGPGDDESRARGARLQASLDGMERELHPDQGARGEG